MIPVIDCDQTSLLNGDYFIEASTAGLKVGEWPEFVLMEGILCGPADRHDNGSHYYPLIGLPGRRSTLVIIND